MNREINIDLTDHTLRLLKELLDPYRTLVETLHAQGRLTPMELQHLRDAVKGSGNGPRIVEAALPRIPSPDTPPT